MEPSVPWAAALGLLEGRSVRGNSTRLVTTHPRLDRFPVQQHNRTERYKERAETTFEQLGPCRRAQRIDVHAGSSRLEAIPLASFLRSWVVTHWHA